MGQRHPSAGDIGRAGARRRPLSPLAALAVLAVLAGCGPSAQEYLRRAQEEPQADAKEALLSKALAMDPDLWPARRQRAWIYAVRGQCDKALADYGILCRTASSPEQLANALYWRGWTLDRCGRFREAVASFSAALRTDPRLLNPYAERAAAYFKLEQYTDAMQDYQTILDRDINRDSREAREIRAEWQLRRGFAACCTGSWAEAAQDFHAALSLTQNTALSAFALLNLYLVDCRIGDKKTADKLLKEGGEDFFRSRPDAASVPWTVHLLSYVAGRLDEGQLLAAAKHPDKATAADRAAAAWYYIGAVRQLGGAKDKAIESLRKCIEHRNPSLPEYHLAKVELERLLSGGPAASDYVALAARTADPEKKIELYSLALKADPNQAAVRLARAQLYSETARYDLAIGDCTALLQIHKDPPETAPALECRARAYLQKGDSDAAVKDFGAAIQADPERTEARDGLADALCQLRRYREAAAVYEQLVRLEINPRDRIVRHIQRAFALSCSGDHQAAAAELRSIADSPGCPPIVHVHLYIAQAKLGKEPDARKALTAYASHITEPNWQNSVAWYAAGRLAQDRLLTLSEHSDPNIQLARTSSAWYYIGAIGLLHGDKARGRQALETCVELGSKLKSESWELRMALVELGRKAPEVSR